MSSEDHPVRTPHARFYAAFAVVLAVVVVALLLVYLPPDTRILLFGETVEHCPDSDLSCPSQRPGLLFLLVIPALILLALTDDD